MSWLIKMGLGVVAPYIIPALLTLIFGGGFAANWWFEWIQITDMVLLAVMGFLIYMYAMSTAEWPKLLYVAGMIGCGYFGGRFHEHDLQQPRIEAARLAVHTKYEDKYKIEVARLERINKDLRDKAAATQIVHMTTRARLRKERNDAIEAAKKLPGAGDTFYTVDDIDVLNRLRHDRKRPHVRSGR
jgi:hypothetical protein